tara:strand:+ start:177 stop:338 length:162 start_codon:yes stop_codon:yes gene_type:complete
VYIRVKENDMVARKAKKRTYRRKNINGNFRGAEDIFMKKVRDGFIEFLKSPFK